MRLPQLGRTIFVVVCAVRKNKLISIRDALDKTNRRVIFAGRCIRIDDCVSGIAVDRNVDTAIAPLKYKSTDCRLVITILVL